MGDNERERWFVVALRRNEKLLAMRGHEELGISGIETREVAPIEEHVLLQQYRDRNDSLERKVDELTGDLNRIKRAVNEAAKAFERRD